LPVRWVNRIKNHLFVRPHLLDDGLRLFDADPAIANAWFRLTEGTHLPADLQLLRHELFVIDKRSGETTLARAAPNEPADGSYYGRASFKIKKLWRDGTLPDETCWAS
jgi:hypothetical protein